MPEPISSQPSPLMCWDPEAEPLPVPAPPATDPLTNTNQQRTSAASSVEPYLDAGLTSSEDAGYLAVAALKGRNPSSGTEVEVFSASVQSGGEMEVQAGMARLGLTGTNGSVSTEFVTARAHGGAHNDDGSVGVNVGALATAAGVEGTWVFGADSVTAGLSISLGADVSVGVRDSDQDGAYEVCARVAYGPVTLGFSRRTDHEPT